MINGDIQVQADTATEAISVYQQWIDAQPDPTAFFYPPVREINKIENSGYVIIK